MKKIKVYIFSFTLCLMASFCHAQDCINADSEQPCCNEQITTDPRPGMAVNTERPSMVNHFDWMTNPIMVYLPTDYMLAGGPIGIINPFFSEQSTDFLDFNPEDGWELIQRHTGFEMNETSFLPATQRLHAPHIILYNRYTGTMRFLKAFADNEGNDYVITILSFDLQSDTSYKTSGLLSYRGTGALALDQKTRITELYGISEFPNKDFFKVDFGLSYDPCTCNNRSVLSFGFVGVDLKGRSGTLVDYDVLHGSEFRLASPGSKDAHNIALVPDRYYPVYNETLGVFGLLETPKVKFHSDHPTWAPVYESFTGKWWSYYKPTFKFQIDDNIRYAYNPSAEINVDESTIQAALVVETPMVESFLGAVTRSGNWHSISTTDGVTRFQSDYYPLGCLGKTVFSVEPTSTWFLPNDNISEIAKFNWMPTFKTYLKLKRITKTNKNRYGKAHTIMAEQTFNAIIEEATIPLIDEASAIPINIIIPPNTHYATSTLVQAWNTISIPGNITLDPGVKVTFRAGQDIVVAETSLLSNEKVKLEIANPSICENVPPQTISQIKTFCQSNKYKANQVEEEQMRKMIAYENEPERMSSNSSLGEPIPNPATSYITIPFDISDESNVRLNLYSSLGEKVLELFNEPNLPRGLYQRKINVDKLPSGVYHITLQVGSSTFTKNIVVSH